MTTKQTPNTQTAGAAHHGYPGPSPEESGEHQLLDQLNTETPASAEPTVRRASTSTAWWDTFNAVARTPMNGDTKAVLSALLSYANGPGHKSPLGDARPGVQRIMEATGLKERAVRGKLKELRAAQWIVETKAGGGALATTYRIQVPTPAPACTPPLHRDAPLPCTGVHPTDSVPPHVPTHSFASGDPETRKASEEDEGLTTTSQAVEAWAKATAAGDEWDAVIDLLAVLEAEHGEGTSDWAANYFSFSAGKARAVLDHPKGSRYGAAKLAGTLLSTASASGCAA